MTTTPDIEAIRKRADVAAKALDVGGISGAFLCVEPILNDIPDLLSHIAALEAERKAELIEVASFTAYFVTGEEWPVESGDDAAGSGLEAYTAYLAQKENKDA